MRPFYSVSLKEYIKLYPHDNLTQIASRIPCTREHISMIASGRRTPSYKMALRIEQVTKGMVKKSNWYQ